MLAEEPGHVPKCLFGFGDIEIDPVRVKHGFEQDQFRIDASR
jgi:hypothetical protein